MDQIVIVTPEGVEKSVYLLTIITLDEYGSSYLVYSEEEIREENNVINFAKMVEEDGKKYLENIIVKEEENAVKEALRKELMS